VPGRDRGCVGGVLTGVVAVEAGVFGSRLIDTEQADRLTGAVDEVVADDADRQRDRVRAHGGDGSQRAAGDQRDRHHEPLHRDGFGRRRKPQRRHSRASWWMYALQSGHRRYSWSVATKKPNRAAAIPRRTVYTNARTPAHAATEPPITAATRLVPIAGARV
jgi:hypothetical protein